MPFNCSDYVTMPVIFLSASLMPMPFSVRSYVNLSLSLAELGVGKSRELRRRPCGQSQGSIFPGEELPWGSDMCCHFQRL
jgi:hypothetical protein